MATGMSFNTGPPFTSNPMSKKTPRKGWTSEERRCLRMLKSVELLRIKDGDVVLFKLGDVKKNILPTVKDLESFRDLLNSALTSIPFRLERVVLPDILKTTVIRKDRS